MEEWMSHPGTFSPSRLSVARRRRGLTTWDMASRLGVQVAKYRRWERGDETPSRGVVERCVFILGFPLKFFYGPEIQPIDPRGCSLS